MYHVIFVCKYRKKILEPINEDLKQAIHDIEKESNFERRSQNKYLKHHYWNEHTLWSDGYFASSIGNVSKEAAEEYIRNQG